MAQYTALTVFGTPGPTHSFTAKTTSDIVYVDPSLMSLMTLQLGGGLGMSLGFKGNTLPVTITTDAPLAAPPGGTGVVFRVEGTNTYIYLWDAVNGVWREH